MYISAVLFVTQLFTKPSLVLQVAILPESFFQSGINYLVDNSVNIFCVTWLVNKLCISTILFLVKLFTKPILVLQVAILPEPHFQSGIHYLVDNLWLCDRV